jgi:outer membrane protein TolC
MAQANSLESSRLNLDVAESVFDVSVTPSTTAGVTDGESAFTAGVSLGKALYSGAVVSVAPELGFSDETYAGSVALALTVPLLRGRGEEFVRSGVRDSEFALRTDRRSYHLSRVAAVIGTVSGVYEILRLKDLEALYRAQISAMTFYAAASRIRKDAGLATPMDVYRAEIRLKDVEDSLSATLQSLGDAEENLKRLLAVDSARDLSVSAPREYESMGMETDEAVGLALASRIEMDQARDTLEERRRKASLARHNLLPQLDLQMGYRRYGSDQGSGGLTAFDEDRWTMSLVSTTDFARTAEKAAFRQSLIGIRNAELDLASLRDQITAEVKQALQVLEKNTERMDIRTEQIRQARGKLELSKVKYRHGMADNFDLIEAETEIQQAEANLLSVRTDYIVGLYQLRAVLGTLIEKPTQDDR